MLSILFYYYSYQYHILYIIADREPSPGLPTTVNINVISYVAEGEMFRRKLISLSGNKYRSAWPGGARKID